MTHKFQITAGLTTNDSRVMMDGKELEGVTRVAFDLTAGAITELSLTIYGEIAVDGEFRPEARVDVRQVSQGWDVATLAERAIRDFRWIEPVGVITPEILPSTLDREHCKQAIIDAINSALLRCAVNAAVNDHAREEIEAVILALGRKAAATSPIADAVGELVLLVRSMIDGDPTEAVADSGETVLDAWRHRAKRLLG